MFPAIKIENNFDYQNGRKLIWSIAIRKRSYGLTPGIAGAQTGCVLGFFLMVNQKALPQ